MALSRRERRVLRDIEEHLAAEDPALAGVLRCVKAIRLERLIRATSQGAIAVAVTLSLIGLYFANGSLMLGGPMMLIARPPLLWLIAVVRGWWG